MTSINTKTKVTFWPIIVTTVLMTTVMAFFSCYFEKNKLKTNISDSMDKTIQWMSLFSKEAILRQNYQVIEQMANTLGEQDAHILFLQVKVPGDFVIAEYKSEFFSDELISKTKKFNFGYHGYYTVLLKQDISGMKKNFSWYVITAIFSAIVFNTVIILFYFIIFYYQEKEFYIQLSKADGLTQLANRRYFNETLSTEWKRAVRGQTYLSLLFIDIDHFKKINDKHGHLAGDDVLQQVAEVIRDGLRRPSDFAARYGGEEFTVLLPETGLDGACSIAEQLRQSVQHMQICQDGDTVINSITVSIGVSTIKPEQHNTAEDFLNTADEMLYMAKKKGRNTCLSKEIS